MTRAYFKWNILPIKVPVMLRLQGIKVQDTSGDQMTILSDLDIFTFTFTFRLCFCKMLQT